MKLSPEESCDFPVERGLLKYLKRMWLMDICSDKYEFVPPFVFVFFV